MTKKIDEYPIGTKFNFYHTHGTITLLKYKGVKAGVIMYDAELEYNHQFLTSTVNKWLQDGTLKEVKK